ncbi:MAG TPA: glycoside hydrolase family 36 protein [Anaerolineales bacterium]|nr:glycoside hydrolase family 36 protein [Anaerolineales bacterium]
MTSNPIDQLILTAETTRQAKGGGVILTGSSVKLGLPSRPEFYLVHGWQSWSLTGWVDASIRLPVMKPTSMHPMQTDPVYANDPRPNGAWYGAARLADGQAVFLGALSLESHVALDGATLTGWYERGGGEWFASCGDEAECLGRYADLLKERLGKGRAAKPYRVWCSWYSLYTEIDEPGLLKILADLGDLPFEIFQVDDGWQKGIGDWEPNAKFPSGMDGLAARIKAAGRTPGLWLAPLLVTPSAPLFRRHPDWLLRDEKGRPVSAGYNWSEKLYALDTTYPEVLEWLKALMGRVRAWGYDYVKLDFLYAGALPGHRHIDMPREAAYRQGLKVIREALGDAYFLTCGAPILPSLGLCDGMRVGPDVAGHWEDPRDRDLLVNFATPGTRNAIRTTLNRLWLKPLVHTDPDVVYFRERQNSLTAGQRGLLQDLAQAAGFKATSDVPAWLAPSEREALRKYLQATPEVRKLEPYVYQIGERRVDFNAAVQMPPLPGRLAKLSGAVIGGLANVPALMKIFDSFGRRAMRKMLKENPV